MEGRNLTGDVLLPLLTYELTSDVDQWMSFMIMEVGTHTVTVLNLLYMC